MKKHLFTLLTSLFLTLPTMAEEPTSVMIMGTFHFANPSADVVKSQQINVMSPVNQGYLEALTDRISGEFLPTHVLLECDPKDQADYDKKFAAYTAGQFKLGANENYQLGFRIAKKSNAKFICYDERQVQWNAEGLMKWLDSENGKEKAAFDKVVQGLTKEVEEMHKTQTLAQILMASNEADRDLANKALYIGLNHIGSGEGFQGADAAASWWHRNFRMYANIQGHAQPGTKVFVLGGQGHTAILKDLLAMDQARKGINVMPLLSE